MPRPTTQPRTHGMTMACWNKPRWRTGNLQQYELNYRLNHINNHHNHIINHCRLLSYGRVPTSHHMYYDQVIFPYLQWIHGTTLPGTWRAQVLCCLLTFGPIATLWACRLTRVTRMARCKWGTWPRRPLMNRRVTIRWGPRSPPPGPGSTEPAHARRTWASATRELRIHRHRPPRRGRGAYSTTTWRTAHRLPVPN